jgi:hypothetical protein
MRRWHTPREHALMFRRWREEMASHEYDWRCPPTGQDACHCAQGIGSMRKRTLGCSRPRCGCCHYGKFFLPKARANELRSALRYESDAVG